MTSYPTISRDAYQALCRHARSQPDAIAYTSRFRIATYRKLRNRIERAAARLHGEWGVRPGDLVAYVGCGHPDALVLYFGLVCCGARLLPLEDASLQFDSARILAELGVRLALIDDDGVAPEGVASYTLSTLIGSVTTHPALQVSPDPCVPSLARMAAPSDAVPLLQESSLADETGLATMQQCEVRGALFDAAMFPQVLATLAGGGVIGFLG
ncbi:AMP-binding protein [Noviherbaspirillum pedocola]|uniref:AMP-binding protein n=1 Tax=Noviherbaspirillum pedocola TaxID=2801341 RepID=A0A934SMP8_9BURK|nr:AMP-binding protein [Noviherbaspirillum pedocola]MBK4733305.1 AMP-binding protein [Noviherbaspirillum pedocola]